jgi:hypothetical protein
VQLLGLILPLLLVLLVLGLVVLFLVLVWNRDRLDGAAFDLGARFGLAHPTVGAFIGLAVWIGIGALLIWRAVPVFKAGDGVSVIAGITGASLSLAAVATWAYAYTRDYDLPPMVGRFLFWFSLLTGVAVAGAFTNSLPIPLQVFCLTLDLAFVAAMVPLLVLGWWRGRRDPTMRAVMSSRAMTFLSGTRPRHRKQVKAR